MNSVYVFKSAPSSIKRLIYLYLIGLGTPTSQLIKEEYDKLFETNKHNIIITRHMSMYEARDIGFMGLFEVSSKKSTSSITLSVSEESLLPKQIYEINTSKLFYLYNCTNAAKFHIIMSIHRDNMCLAKLLRYKYLQLSN